MRGLVLPLTAKQRLRRFEYLGGLATLADLDEFVRKDGAPLACPEMFYLLKRYNGGKDPTAPDPATRWKKPGSTFENRTCDCSGGVAWACGFDRYQPERFQHIYDGWINTDSKRLDADGPRRAFRRLDRPEPGCIIVYASDPKGVVHGVPVGHEGGVIAVPAEWDPKVRECWIALKVVDVAARKGRANRVTTGLGWFRKNAYFLVPTMTPSTTAEIDAAVGR